MSRVDTLQWLGEMILNIVAETMSSKTREAARALAANQPPIQYPPPLPPSANQRYTTQATLA